MPHYPSNLSGEHLKLLLIEFGFQPTRENTSRVTLAKDGQVVGFTKHLPIPQKRVEAICDRFKITAEHCNELLRKALAKNQRPGASIH